MPTPASTRSRWKTEFKGGVTFIAIEIASRLFPCARQDQFLSTVRTGSPALLWKHAMTNLVLTPEFDEALTLLHGGHNLFLTGKAGTGKSTLVRLFHEQTQRRVIVAAPTGIADLNVDGYTIHRLFSFHPTMSVEQVRRGDYYPGAFGQADRKSTRLNSSHVAISYA